MIDVWPETAEEAFMVAMKDLAITRGYLDGSRPWPYLKPMPARDFLIGYATYLEHLIGEIPQPKGSHGAN